MYVPPEEYVTKDFLKQVLTEEKDLLPIREVKWVNMPKFDELSVKQIMPEVRKYPEFMHYFPSITRKS